MAFNENFYINFKQVSKQCSCSGYDAYDIRTFRKLQKPHTAYMSTESVASTRDIVSQLSLRAEIWIKQVVSAISQSPARRQVLRRQVSRRQDVKFQNIKFQVLSRQV